MSKTVPVYGNDTMCVAATIEVAKEAADGSRCANVLVDETKDSGKKFRALFEARYTKIPSSLFYAALGYDSVIVAQQILTGQKSTVATVLGNHTRRENGLYEIMPEILEIQPGRMVGGQR